MGLNGFGKTIVLYALVLLFAASVLGNESLNSDASEKEEVAVPPQIEQLSKFSDKEDEANREKVETIKDDVQTPIKDSSPLKDVVDKEALPLQKLGIDMKKSEKAGSEVGKDTEFLAQSDMHRLSRFLRNFHERQRINGDDEVGFERKASYVSDDYGDAVAEERAIRRRKRVRRRKIYSNIGNTGQRRRNSNNVTRRKSSNVRKGSNVRGGNVRNPSRRSGVRQRPSNGNKYAYRKGNKKQPNRKQSQQKRKKNKKNNKNKNKNKNKKPQKPSSQDSSSAPPKDQSQTQDTQQSAA